jgi:DNA polymerase III epsilon subunit-like protein
MTYFMIDIESDGPIPGDYSMISLGAVIVEAGLQRTFYARLKPVGPKWNEEALALCGLTRADTLQFDDPEIVMTRFEEWILKNRVNQPMFISDNNGFDWQFVNYYFHHLLGRNPFGHSSTNLGSLYKGMVKDTRQNFKHLRQTRHTHHPVQDALGNAEALLHMKNEMGLHIAL